MEGVQIYNFKYLEIQNLNQTFSFVPEPNLGSRNPKHRGIECFGKDLRMTERLSKIEIKWLIEAYNNYPEKDKFFSPGFFSARRNGKS